MPPELREERCTQQAGRSRLTGCRTAKHPGSCQGGLRQGPQEGTVARSCWARAGELGAGCAHAEGWGRWVQRPWRRGLAPGWSPSELWPPRPDMPRTLAGPGATRSASQWAAACDQCLGAALKSHPCFTKRSGQDFKGLQYTADNIVQQVLTSSKLIFSLPPFCHLCSGCFFKGIR